MEKETEGITMQEVLTRGERDRLAERLLPGEKILWQGKSHGSWRRKAAQKGKGMLLLIFFAAVWGTGFYMEASAPVWTGETMLTLAVMGICCFSGVAILGMLLVNAVLETRRANAVLHALTDIRLLSLGPSADGKGVLFQQWKGAELRRIRLVTHRDGTKDLIFRYRFPPAGKPEPEGWPALPGAEEVCGQIRRAFPGMAVSRLP